MQPNSIIHSADATLPLTAATRVRNAFEEVTNQQKHFLDPNGRPDALWPVLKELHESADVLTKLDVTLLDQFAKLVGDGGPLSRAVNEVMALLTPARWAYEDIVARADFAAGKSTFELETPDAVPVRFRLNTAELNTFSLTLFLLCARQVQNALRIIVLDDPLQNMDELTVTTVARGASAAFAILEAVRSWQHKACMAPPRYVA